jgi:hypothetical protein
VAEAGAEESAAQPLSRRRKSAVWALVFLASAIALIAILTTWANRQLLDNHSWHRASSQVIRNKDVQSALATELVNELYANVNVGAELQQRLPKEFKPLADPAAAALREPITKAVEFLLSQPRFQTLFIQASDAAHTTLVNILENKTKHGLSTANGVVTLNVLTLLKEIASELGLPGAVLSRIPADAGQITIMKSDQLATAQKAVRWTHALSVIFLVLVFALYAAAMYLARGNRRRTLAGIGWGLVVVGILVLIARRLIGNYVISSLVADDYRKPSHIVYLIYTSILGAIGWATIMYGLLAILGAMLAGPWRAAVWLRREAAPVLNQRQGVAWGAVGIVYLLLVLWGPTHALRTWWGILLVGALLAAAVYVLRRQTLQEFPEAGLTPPEKTVGARMAAAARGVTSHAHRREHAPAAAAPRSPAEEIAHLLELKDKGAITEDEFEQAKKLALA